MSMEARAGYGHRVAPSSNPRLLTVAVAERHPVMSGALCGTLEAEPDIDLVGRTPSYNGMLALLRRQRPQVLLLDPGVLGARGLHALRTICATHRDTAVVVSAFPEWRGYEQAVCSMGAAGMLSKTAPPMTLLKTIRDAGRRCTDDAPRLATLRSGGGTVDFCEHARGATATCEHARRRLGAWV
jgi:DNA-binding NarL/FixJ family response regulator